MSETVESLKARIAELEKLVYVPGLWKCAKCNFSLMQATISANSGAVSTRDQPGERCPNCDVPLWRVTERESSDGIALRCEEAIVEASTLRASLKKIAERAEDNLPMRTPGAMVHIAEVALANPFKVKG